MSPSGWQKWRKHRKRYSALDMWFNRMLGCTFDALLLLSVGGFLTASFADPLMAIPFVFSLALLAGLFRLRWQATRSPTLTSLPSVPADIHKRIEPLLSPFSRAIGLPISTIEFVLDVRAAHPYPSVVSNSSRRIVILPVGFIRFLRLEPDIAKAMLEHEVAHFDQRDQQLWGYTALFSRIINRVLAPLFGSFAILGALTFYGEKHSSGPGMHPPDPTTMSIGLFFLCIFFSVERAAGAIRLRSEKLADTAVVLYSDGPALAKVLAHLSSTIVSNGKRVPFELAERQLHLRRVLRDFGFPVGGAETWEREHTRRKVLRTLVLAIVAAIAVFGIAVILFP